MNKVKRTTAGDRIRAAWNALRGKPVSQITFGLKVTRCDECRRGGLDKAGCYFCEDAGVHHVAPIGHQDGLGVLVPEYCFNCGRRLYIPWPGEKE